MINAQLAKQRGAAILISVVLLLVLVLLVSLYTGKIKSLEHKVLLNEQNYRLAFAASEAGLMHGFGMLDADPDWLGGPDAQVLGNNAGFTVQGVRQLVVRDSGELTLLTLTSTGTSPDGLATVNMSEQAIQYSLLANAPDAPLIVAGGLAVGGNFEVTANPNGGGTGVPLSIWTDQAVDLNNGSGTTCGLYEYNQGNCSTEPYSEAGFKGLDIVDNDPGFPDDLMEYLFNVPDDNWADLRADATEILADCTTLSAASVGLIWVDGDCTINAGTVIGTPTSPVILIVTDGDIKMNGGALLHGILFSFRKPGVVADFEIDMAGGAHVLGVVASNHPVGHANGTYNAVYDASVLTAIEQHDAFIRVARVPGSWRDF